MSADSLRKATFTGPQRVMLTPPKSTGRDKARTIFARPYKTLLPRDLVVSMALVYLPKDGTDWLPRLHAAHKNLSESCLIGDAADVPAKVALDAFESMGYQYMQVENGEWRGRLGSIANKHWTLLRNGGEQELIDADKTLDPDAQGDGHVC